MRTSKFHRNSLARTWNAPIVNRLSKIPAPKPPTSGTRTSKKKIIIPKRNLTTSTSRTKSHAYRRRAGRPQKKNIGPGHIFVVCIVVSVVFGLGIVMLQGVANSQNRRSGNVPTAIETMLAPVTPPIVTLGEYSRLQTGMSYTQAKTTIGSSGVEISRNYMEGVPGVMESISTVMYSWSNADGSNMNAIFQNDKLMQKAQFGLR